MAYQTAITIKDAIGYIQNQDYVLPSIQREFVWTTNQIEMLFDSLMRDYPISTFLFWKVDKTRIKDFQFYEFLKNYHEKKNTHNSKVDLTNDKDVVALLDGQQRLTSLYVALTGSYAKKKPYHQWNNDAAFPLKNLHLNLLSPSLEMETEFQFKFLAADEVDNSKDCYWFDCSQILEFTDQEQIAEFLMKNGLMDTSKLSEAQTKFALRTLTKFYKVIHQKATISFYLEESLELDKVLQIFIRINSGGTVLSYSDLLLSIATAQWTERDAREVILEFVDDINKIGDGFEFSKDNVLKTCLVLADLDVKFKVDNFTKENMEKIEKNWDGISLALKVAVKLVSNLGYRRDNLQATNAIIPIAYFIYKNGFENSILLKGKRDDDRNLIGEWLARVLLKGTFGGQPDSIYPQMRKLINENLERFPLAEIISHYSGQRKSISFSEEDVDNLLNLEYGKRGTYSALSVLYPKLNYSFHFHQDHIHPKSSFDAKKMRQQGYTADQIETFKNLFNSLPNLQLLEGTQNMEKSAQFFVDWLSEKYHSQSELKTYLQQHFIPTDVSLDFKEFVEFYNARRDVLKEEFIRILGVTASASNVEKDMVSNLNLSEI